MRSSLINKIEKGRRYAQQQGRVQFTEFALRFQGDHRAHEVAYRGGRWTCSCAYFPTHGACSHTMAVERILEGMLPATTPAIGGPA